MLTKSQSDFLNDCISDGIIVPAKRDYLVFVETYLHGKARTFCYTIHAAADVIDAEQQAIDQLSEAFPSVDILLASTVPLN